MPSLKARGGGRSSDAPDPRRTLRRRWRRFWSRVPEGVPSAAGFGTELVIGLALLTWGGAGNRIPGTALGLLGAAGLFWEGWRWRRRLLLKQRRRHQDRMRLEQRALRRLREMEEHKERHKRMATDAAAHARAKEIQAANRLVESERAEAEDRRRRAAELAIAAEAQRLLTLDDNALSEAAAQVFDRRGFTVARAGDEADCDLLLQISGRAGGAVARCVPRARRAEPTDVKALEAWRRETGRSTAAYLIGLDGFSPAAVRLAQGLPITLVDAHLLAQWGLGPTPVS